MTAPPEHYGAVVWESARSTHAKCMDCRWGKTTGTTNETAKRHVDATGHSVMMSGMMTYLVVPERGRQ